MGASVFLVDRRTTQYWLTLAFGASVTFSQPSASVPPWLQMTSAPRSATCEPIATCYKTQKFWFFFVTTLNTRGRCQNRNTCNAMVSLYMGGCCCCQSNQLSRYTKSKLSCDISNANTFITQYEPPWHSLQRSQAPNHVHLLLHGCAWLAHHDSHPACVAIAKYVHYLLPHSKNHWFCTLHWPSVLGLVKTPPARMWVVEISCQINSPWIRLLSPT